MAKVKDYILSLDHDDAADIWDAYAWVANPEDSDDEEDPVDRDFQNAENAGERKLRVQHNKAFRLIRDSLSQEIFNKTLRLPHSVPKLLRFLQSNWNDGSSIDRDRLRQQYIEMKLADYADLDCYATAFTNLVLTMREHKIGMAANDDDVLFHFNKSMPAAWDQVKLASTAQRMDFEASIQFYLSNAKRDGTLPGTTKNHQNRLVRYIIRLKKVIRLKVEIPRKVKICQVRRSFVETFLEEIATEVTSASTPTSSHPELRLLASNRPTKGPLARSVERRGTRKTAASRSYDSRKLPNKLNQRT
jgi:hypothetical protein